MINHYGENCKFKFLLSSGMTDNREIVDKAVEHFKTNDGQNKVNEKSHAEQKKIYECMKNGAHLFSPPYEFLLTV